MSSSRRRFRLMWRTLTLSALVSRHSSDTRYGLQPLRLNVRKQAAELQFVAVLETVKDVDPRAALLLALGRESALAVEKRQLEQDLIARETTIGEKDVPLQVAQQEIDRLKADRQTSRSV